MVVQPLMVTGLNLFLLVFLTLTSPAVGSVGEVSFQSREAQITRGSDKFLTKVGTEVEMNDSVETLKGRVTIIFVDKTKVSISEYSKLIIDDFVYNANNGTGRVNLKAGLGSLRYTSGLIAKNSKENIKITTPTASVSVRGTDFEIVVTEAGKSTFTLLPSIDADGSTYTGAIEVSNATGTVVLTKPFQVTTVVSSYAPPTVPRVNKIRQQRATETDKKEDKDEEDKDDEPENESTEVEEEEVEVEEEEMTEEDLFNIVKNDESSSIFIEKDGKAVFESDSENKVKLILSPDADVSLRYDNKGQITEGNLNNGGNVTINIIQQ